MAAPTAQGFIYWTNYETTGAIDRANLDGTGSTAFIPTDTHPRGVVVDSRYIYWANFGGGSGTSIGRANIDGTGANQNFINGADGPVAPAVDSNYIYWTNVSKAGVEGDGTTVARANIDGSGVPNQSFVTGAKYPCGAAVDNDYVYWAEGNNNSIGRASKSDGSGADHAFITGSSVNSPCGVAVAGGYIYWANNGGLTIGRASLADPSGTAQELVSGGYYPCGVAVDTNHIYWANASHTHGVGRANLDGSGAVADFLAGDGPCGVAVDALGPQPGTTSGGGSQPLALAAISSLRTDPSAFAALGRGGSIIARKRSVPKGTKVSYRDSQPATTTFTVLKRVRGVKRGKKCVKPPRKKGKKKLRSCKRDVSLGSFRHVDTAGANSFRFTGRVRGRKLRRGRYSLRAVPRYGGRDGSARTAKFRIIG